MRRVLVTGSRKLDNEQTVHTALWAQARIAGNLDDITIIHGKNPNGADKWAHTFCQQWKVAEEPYPADWDQYGKAAGHIRNGAMVDRGADVCLAFPREGSKGTWDCIRRAKEAGIPVVMS
jgi:hypothetical protein